MRIFQSPEALQAAVGEELGVSGWFDVGQDRIDAFAEATGDRQWIHVDVERARRESPYGGTVAHGYLTLSMLPAFIYDVIRLDGVRQSVNYGSNRVRFPAPVPAGSRVRASAEVTEVEDVGGGWWQVVTRFTVEVEGSDKPACVADSVGRALPE